MSDYESKSPPSSPKADVKPDVKPVVKKKREGVKMSDKQKQDLTKHMLKVGKDMTVSEKKSHRMKMMGRMRRGESIGVAHKAISK